VSRNENKSKTILSRTRSKNLSLMSWILSNLSRNWD